MKENETSALNAELLAALTQMENWASELGKLYEPVVIENRGLYWQEIEQARAVVAKAKKLE